MKILNRDNSLGNSLLFQLLTFLHSGQTSYNYTRLYCSLNVIKLSNRCSVNHFIASYYTYYIPKVVLAYYVCPYIVMSMSSSCNHRIHCHHIQNGVDVGRFTLSSYQLLKINIFLCTAQILHEISGHSHSFQTHFPSSLRRGR